MLCNDHALFGAEVHSPKNSSAEALNPNVTGPLKR